MKIKVFVVAAFLCSASISYSQKDNTQEIKNTISSWVDGFNAGDYKKAISIYADDFVGYYLNQADQTPNTIKEQYNHILNNKNLSVIISFDADEIQIFGDHAYVRMTLTAKIKPSYAPQPSFAIDKGLQVWRKETNGGWKIIRSASFPVVNDKSKTNITK